jgi:HEAT repeat protein
VRRAAAEVLACYPGERATLGLHVLAKDPETDVRKSAFFALATSRPEEAVIALEAVLADEPDEDVRGAARDALAMAINSR